MANISYEFVLPMLKNHNPEHVQSIDPLEFDSKIRVLHLLNQNKDMRGTCQLLIDILPKSDQLNSFNYFESLATMRELGIFLGIIKKHDLEPVEEVPELVSVLLNLSKKTNLPPRDTLSHYTLWNPLGTRMRTYTGNPEEVALVESVKIAFPDLLTSIHLLDSLYDRPYLGEEFEQQCNVVKDCLESMIDGIVHAKKNVSPAFFANELRYYYEPILVDKPQAYIGPGAVEMPMFLVDHILWNCDIVDKEYTDFKEGYLPYNIPYVTELYYKYKNKPSIRTKIMHQLDQNPSKSCVKAAEIFLGFFNTLKSFRMPHKKLAEKVYAHNNEQHKQKGSGGYAVDILTVILNMQNESINQLQSKINTLKIPLVMI